MTAQLATADDHLLARGRQYRSIRNGSTVPETASDKPQVGGMQFDCGYQSPHFVTDPERIVAFENVYILVHERKIKPRKDLLPLLEQVNGSGKPLLMAEDVEGEGLAALVVNKLRGRLQVAAVRAPGFGDQRKSSLREVALLTGCKAITEGLDIQLKNIQLSDLGRVEKITIGKNNTMVEGTAQYGWRSREHEGSIHSPTHISTVHSSQMSSSYVHASRTMKQTNCPSQENTLIDNDGVI